MIHMRACECDSKKDKPEKAILDVAAETELDWFDYQESGVSRIGEAALSKDLNHF
jgi:hypothetical protein